MKRRTVFLSVVLTCAMIFSSAIGINAENFDKNAMTVTSYKLARQGGSYIYINYNSASGATLRAQQTVEGNEGEYLDVYDYVIDISGMEVDRIEPSAHVMFDKNKRGRVSIIYKNVAKQDNRNEPKDNPDYPRYDPKDNPDYPRYDPKDNPDYPRYDPKDDPKYNPDYPRDNPDYPKDKPDHPNSDPQGGDCYIYVNYESDAGHTILAQKLIKGYQGETLDLNDYMEDITTMKFVKFKPSRTLTFNKNRRGSGTLIYTKVTRPVENPTDKPDYPKDKPDYPNSDPQGGDCYIYVNYESDAGHTVLAQKLIKGYQGETLDLNDYMEDIATMKFVKFKPSRTLTFNKNRRGSGTLIYTKVTRPVENPTDDKAANEPVNTNNNTGDNFVLQNTIDPAKRNGFAYISGVGNGMMNPNAPITRAEAAVMLYNIMSPEYKKMAATSVQKRIAEAESIYSGYNSDVGFDMWYSNAVNAVSAEYIIPSRMTSMFSPEEYMTRADVAYALAKFAGESSASGATIFTDLGTEADSSVDAINKVANLGWINGYEDGTFKPSKNVTRAEFTVMVNAMLGRTGTYSYSAGDKTFNDVNVNAWYYNAVMLAVNG